MNPRGVTLVELLAAISILVVLTALSLPALQNRLSAARLDAAQGQLQAAALATRADAMRQGRSLSLVARTTSEGEVELLISPLLKSESEGSEAEKGGERSSGSVWVTLPGGVKFLAQPPIPAEDTSRVPVSESKDIKLAVFCPDGSAVTSPVYLTFGDSVMVVTVNAWIGGVKFAAYTAESREASDRGESKSSESSETNAVSKRAGVGNTNSPPLKGGER